MSRDVSGVGLRRGSFTETTLMMSRNPKNVHPLFSYTLFSRQLGLRSIVPEEEMRKLVDYDEDGNSCIAVLMRGATSAKRSSSSFILCDGRVLSTYGLSRSSPSL